MRPLAPVLLLALLPLVACSGDDGESLQDRRDAYIADAEEICAETNTQVEELGTPTSIPEIPAAADEAVAIVRDTVERITALEPPQEDVDRLQERVLGPLAEDVGVAEEYAGKIKAAAAANDGPALLALVNERPQTSADLAYMRDYGFSQCVAAADQRD